MGENVEYRVTLKKILFHLKTVLTHKHYVFKYCCMCGIPYRGIVHDLSKFSVKEFWPNVKYVTPGVSPIDIQKKLYGYCDSWLHHKGHNKHHYEYWMDRFDDGCYVCRMPYKYSVEALCDCISASRAYNGKNFSYNKLYEWWQKQRVSSNRHPNNRDFLQIIILELKLCEDSHSSYKLKDLNKIIHNDILNKEHLSGVYEEVLKECPYPVQLKIKQPMEEK